MSKIQRMTEEEKLKTSAIIELYTAVQSEGSRAGMPTIVVRTTGCTHRCWFGDGGWCDSFYTSIHPEKAKYSLNDVITIYNNNPHIREMIQDDKLPNEIDFAKSGYFNAGFLGLKNNNNVLNFLLFNDSPHGSVFP